MTFETERDDFVGWFELERALDTAISKIGERTLQHERGLFSTLFLNHFKEHVQTSKDEQILVGNRKRDYIEDLFVLFYRLVFEKVAGSDESFDFWSSFPREWKVTKNNLLNKENRVVRISHKIFIQWAAHIIQTNQTFDRQLDDVSKTFFQRYTHKRGL